LPHTRDETDEFVIITYNPPVCRLYYASGRRA
jgi:hypothetical protein